MGSWFPIDYLEYIYYHVIIFTTWTKKVCFNQRCLWLIKTILEHFLLDVFSFLENHHLEWINNRIFWIKYQDVGQGVDEAANYLKLQQPDCGLNINIAIYLSIYIFFAKKDQVMLSIHGLIGLTCPAETSGGSGGETNTALSSIFDSFDIGDWVRECIQQFKSIMIVKRSPRDESKQSYMWPKCKMTSSCP